jgi:mannose-6-phosphate isomerase-like protein (cupin superfamily)
MNRRVFVQSVAACAVFGTLRAVGPSPVNDRKPVLVRAGADRQGDRHFMAGGRIAFDAKVATADTGGGLFLWENLMTTKGGPGRHLHFDQEEWFYVLEGRYVIEVGEERFFLNVGDSIYLPRGVPHVWAHISDGTGRLLGAVQPAGTFEQFVDEVRQAGSGITPKQQAELAQKHGMKNLGPPLDLSTL